MKILILILILISSKAQARSKLHDMPMDEIEKVYKSAMKRMPDKDKVFIPANTIFCSSEKKLQNIRSYAINHNGIVNSGYAKSAGCRIMRGWSVGVMDESNIKTRSISLVFKFPMGEGVDYGYFNLDNLMTLEARKALSRSN
jgi:hypothetical protein